MEQIYTLLQAVIALITMLANPNVVVPEEVRLQGEAIVIQAVEVVNVELARLQQNPAQAPVTSNQKASDTMTGTTSTATNSSPTPESTPSAPAPVSQARLEIVSLLEGPAIVAYEAQDDSSERKAQNYVELGLVVYDNNGNMVSTAEVTITATDDSQNKVMNGTSSNYRNKLVYGYTYDFKTEGDHTITFTANGMTKSITIQVQ